MVNLDELRSRTAGTHYEALSPNMGTKLLLMDDDTTVWEIRLEPGEATTMCRSDYWYDLIHLRGDELTVVPHAETRGEWNTVNTLPIQPKTSNLVAPGGADLFVNTGKTPYLGYKVELPQLHAERGYRPESRWGRFLMHSGTYDRMCDVMRKIPLEMLEETIGTDLHYEDEDIQLWSMRLEPCELGPLHRHLHEYCCIYARGDRTGGFANPLLFEKQPEYDERNVCIGKVDFNHPGGSELSINTGHERYRVVQILFRKNG